MISEASTATLMGFGAPTGPNQLCRRAHSAYPAYLCLHPAAGARLALSTVCLHAAIAPLSSRARAAAEEWLLVSRLSAVALGSAAACLAAGDVDMEAAGAVHREDDAMCR